MKRSPSSNLSACFGCQTSSEAAKIATNFPYPHRMCIHQTQGLPQTKPLATLED